MLTEKYFTFSDKVKVAWKVVSKDPNSPFAGITGVETFDEGEEESHIEIDIPQDPRDVRSDAFDVILSDPKPSTSVVDQNNKCSVTVDNDVIEAVVNLDKDEVGVKQSDGKVELLVVRSEQLQGNVVVPWKVLPSSSDSVYTNLSGFY